MDQDRLYFPRKLLAEQILLSFESQLQHATTLFAPRRKGKTQFILRDLLPLAESKGFLVAYADLWLSKDNPELVICTALAKALHETSLLTKLGTWWASPKRQLKGLKVGVGLDQASAEGELADTGAPPLNDLFERFKVAGRGRAILVIDEVQHLATKPAFENFTAQLRSLLTTSQGEVFTVFTGSSQDGLASMFRKSKAPFYQFGSQVGFPDLGRDFAEHFGRLYLETTHKAWETEAAFELYLARGATPHYLRTLYTICITQGVTVAEADKIAWAGIVDEGQFAALLDDLPPLDQLLLRGIVTKAALYSEEFRRGLADELPSGMMPSTQQVQSGLERLRKRDLIANLGHGQWEVEEHALESYLRRIYLGEPQ